MANATDIAEEVVVGGLPGSENAAQSPVVAGEKVNVRARPGAEYVAGRSLQWYSSLPQALPWSLDDITRDFGDDIYERMLFDPQIKSLVNVFKAGVLDNGLLLQPAVNKKEDDGYEKATTYMESAERMFDEMDGGMDEFLWSMLDSITFGSKLAEMMFDLDSSYTGKMQYVLRNLSVKPREATAFVTDVYMKVLGILGRVPGQPFGVQQGMILTSLKDMPNFLPRSKFAVLTFRPKDGDPRGSSILRSSFDPWNSKVQLKREYLKYLTQFATPSLIGYAPEKAQSYPMMNPDGTPAVDANGNAVLRAPEADMIAAYESFANGTSIAFPYGAQTQVVEMKGDGAAFRNAMELHDMQIAKAILNQILATEEGQHQTRAASGTHKDVLDSILRQAKRPVERMIRRDILRVWMLLNGNVKDIALMPRVTLGTSEAEDLAPLWEAAAALRNADYLDPSQFPLLDTRLQLPERSPTDPGEVPQPVRETIRDEVQAGPGAPPPTTVDPTVQPGGDPRARPAPVSNPPAPRVPAAAGRG